LEHFIGATPGQCFIQGDPDAVQIAAVIDLPSDDLLRCHVGIGAHDIPQCGDEGVAGVGCQTQIQQDHLPGGRAVDV
jgi:hypothetical protein